MNRMSTMRNSSPEEQDKKEAPLPLDGDSHVVDHGTQVGASSTEPPASATTHNESVCRLVIMLAGILGGGAFVLLLVVFLGDEESPATTRNKNETTTTAEKNVTQHPTQPDILPNLPNVPASLAPPTSPLFWIYSDDYDSVNWTTTVGRDCPFNAENAVPNREVLQRAIQFYFQQQEEPFSNNETTWTTPTKDLLLPYGWPIGTWCIGHENLTSFHSAFYLQPIGDNNDNSNNETTKNYHSIEAWDVSRITDIRHVFQSARQFDQDLSTWNTERVERLDFAFTHATAFNGDVTTWDTGKVTSMQFLFCDAEHFNQDLSGWNTSNVEFLGSMFLRAPSFTADLSSWDVGNVRDMSAMFSQSSGYWISGSIDPVLPPLFPGETAWPTSAPTAVPTAAPTQPPQLGLIYGDISGWNVARVESFRDMFRDNTNISSLDLCAWGDVMRPDANVANMFRGTNCPETGDPNLTAIPPGPFCVPCLL